MATATVSASSAASTPEATAPTAGRLATPNYADGSNGVFNVKLSRIEAPATTAMLFECDCFCLIPAFTWWDTTWPGAVHDVYPHNSGQNVAFCDGHAKWVSRENLRMPLFTLDPKDDV